MADLMGYTFGAGPYGHADTDDKFRMIAESYRQRGTLLDPRLSQGRSYHTDSFMVSPDEINPLVMLGENGYDLYIVQQIRFPGFDTDKASNGEYADRMPKPTSVLVKFNPLLYLALETANKAVSIASKTVCGKPVVGETTCPKYPECPQVGVDCGAFDMCHEGEL